MINLPPLPVLSLPPLPVLQDICPECADTKRITCTDNISWPCYNCAPVILPPLPVLPAPSEAAGFQLPPLPECCAQAVAERLEVCPVCASSVVLPPLPALNPVQLHDAMAAFGESIDIAECSEAANNIAAHPHKAPDTSDWQHTSQEPWQDGVYEIQQTFGEIHKLEYRAARRMWYYPKGGSMCCEHDSLHVIASGWRGLTYEAYLRALEELGE